MSEGISLKELHKKFPYLDEMEKRADEYDEMTEKEKNHVDNTDGYDFLPFTQYWEEVFLSLGNEYKASPDCANGNCVIDEAFPSEDYVCWECRLNTLQWDHSKWGFKYYE